VERREAAQAQLTPCSRELFQQRSEACLALETRLAAYDMKLATMGQAHPACQRLQTMPGIGPVTATALIAAIGEATPFTNGRHLAAWLGWVPREHSTGGKPRLLGISTRGDVYLRTLVVHGARATLRWIETKADDRSQWLRALIARRGKNRAALALANKNARMVWALLVHHQEYRARIAASSAGGCCHPGGFSPSRGARRHWWHERSDRLLQTLVGHMACEAAGIMRRRSAYVIKARRALEALHYEAGYITASVLLRASVQRPLGFGGGSIYLAKSWQRLT
jgi:hypothetical protein